MSNGYITITIEGQAIGLKFGMPAIKRIYEKVSEKKDGGYNEEDCAHFLYAGYLNNCIVKDVEPALTYEFFYNFAETCLYVNKDATPLTDVIKCFSESRIVKSLNEEAEKKSPVKPKRKTKPLASSGKK